MKINLHFHQSINVVNTKFEFDNSLHRALLHELVQPTRNHRAITRIMKKIGMKPGIARDFLPHIRWSSDIKLVQLDAKTGTILRQATK